MHIVAARMHRWKLVAEAVGGDSGGGVREPCIFFDGEAIHIGAHHDGRAVAIAHNADNAGSADTFGHLEAERAQFGGHPSRGLVFFEAEFWVGVQVFVQWTERLPVLSDGTL